MSAAPGIGVRSSDPCPACGAQETRRVLSPVRSNREYQRGRDKYPYVAKQFGPLAGAHRSNALGQPIIESAAHEREVGARNGLKRD